MELRFWLENGGAFLAGVFICFDKNEVGHDAAGLASLRVPVGLIRPLRYVAQSAVRLPWRAGSNPGLSVLTGFRAG
jgi:hypothetical protein